MNRVFSVIIFISLVLLLIFSPENFINSLINGAEKGVNLSFSLICIYAVWMSILELIKQTKLNEKLKKLLHPLIKKLFKIKDNTEAENEIAINISSNLLGMGNAATPSGIKAMQLLDDKSGKMNRPMSILMMLNACALQIIPTTIIGLRVYAGSSNASDILLPSIIATFTTSSLAVFIALIIEKQKRKQKK